MKRKHIRNLFLFILGVVGLIIAFNWGLITYGVRQGMGQLGIVWNARPVEVFLTDPAFPDSLKEKLKLIDEVRKYAIDSLGLTDTENYKTMFDQQGKEVMWVVTACEAFRLKPKLWSFPVVGTVPYKGFFEQEEAAKEADKLKKEGWDVSVRNPGGWSTLGWFNDPILSGMLKRSDGDLAGLIIHEMVHSTVWVPDSADFNENLASFIGDTAAYNFLKWKFGAASPQYVQYLHEDKDYRKFSGFVLGASLHLDSLYQTMNDSMTLERKKVLKETAIRHIVSNMDTLNLYLSATPSRRYASRLPNNAYFMAYRHYQSRQTDFKHEYGREFNGDLKGYIKHWREKYPVL